MIISCFFIKEPVFLVLELPREEESFIGEEGRGLSSSSPLQEVPLAEAPPQEPL